jgi:hypothetical protein
MPEFAWLSCEIPPAFRSKSFEVPRGEIRVHSDSEALLETLVDFFHPYLSAPHLPYGRTHCHDIVSIDDRASFERVLRVKPVRSHDVIHTNFTHDLADTLAVYRGPPGEHTLIHDARLKLFYLAAPDRRTTVVFSTDDSATWVGVLHLIRTAWMLRGVQNPRAHLVHTAAFERNGQGILITGAKYSGKTTALLDLASRRGYNSVTNDRLFLLPEAAGEKPRAVGLPTVIKLRWSTLPPFFRVHDLMKLDYCMPRDLAEWLGVGLKREVRIATFIFLSHRPDQRRPIFRRIGPEEARKMLANNLYPLSQEGHIELLGLGPCVDDHSKRRISQLAPDLAYFHPVGDARDLHGLADLMDPCSQESDPDGKGR